MANDLKLPSASAARFADYFDYIGPPEAALRPPGRSVLRAEQCRRVVDGWPARVPVSPAELDVLEAHFTDLFETLRVPPAR